MSRSGREPVKVVIINTEYVETDAGSFKSVVQKLTGKDAIVAGSSSSSKERSYLRPDPSVAGLDKNWSMMEFERLLKEMPTVDELCRTRD